MKIEISSGFPYRRKELAQMVRFCGGALGATIEAAGSGGARGVMSERDADAFAIQKVRQYRREGLCI